VQGEAGVVNVESQDVVWRLPKTTTTSCFAAYVGKSLEVLVRQCRVDAVYMMCTDSLAIALR